MTIVVATVVATNNKQPYVFGTNNKQPYVVVTVVVTNNQTTTNNKLSYVFGKNMSCSKACMRHRLAVVGCWLLVGGCWLVGCWLLVVVVVGWLVGWWLLLVVVVVVVVGGGGGGGWQALVQCFTKLSPLQVFSTTELHSTGWPTVQMLLFELAGNGKGMGVLQ